MKQITKKTFDLIDYVDNLTDLSDNFWEGKLKTDIININKSKIILEEEKNVAIEDMNAMNKKLADEHERKIEDKERSQKKEIENHNKNFDENISHYKSLFENERIRFESGILSQRES